MVPKVGTGHSGKMSTVPSGVVQAAAEVSSREVRFGNANSELRCCSKAQIEPPRLPSGKSADLNPMHGVAFRVSSAAGAGI